MKLRIVKLAAALTLSLLTGPLPAEAQAGKAYRIGLLPGTSPPTSAAFPRTLHDLGWVEGQNLLIEARFAEGKLERLPGMAAELVRLLLRADQVIER